MEFHTFQTHYQMMKQALARRGERHKPSAAEFWPKYVKTSVGVNALSVGAAAAQVAWEFDRQPYYNVWPCVLPMLLKLDLEKLQSEFVTPVLPTLAVRLPVTGNPICGPNYTVKSFLVAHVGGETKNRLLSLADSGDNTIRELNYVPMPSQFTGVPVGTRGFMLVIDIGEKFKEDANIACFTLRRFQLQDGQSIAHQMRQFDIRDPAADFGVQITPESVAACVKLYCTLCLLDEDSELVDRIVLTADRLKYKQTKDPKFIKKAEQRGVQGWDIGRELEVVPHLRRPHFAIRWTGPGGAVAKLRPIKASVVHREKLLDVPTGYAADNVSTPSV